MSTKWIAFWEKHPDALFLIKVLFFFVGTVAYFGSCYKTTGRVEDTFGEGVLMFWALFLIGAFQLYKMIYDPTKAEKYHPIRGINIFRTLTTGLILGMIVTMMGAALVDDGAAIRATIKQDPNEGITKVRAVVDHLNSNEMVVYPLVWHYDVYSADDNPWDKNSVCHNAVTKKLQPGEYERLKQSIHANHIVVVLIPSRQHEIVCGVKYEILGVLPLELATH